MAVNCLSDKDINQMDFKELRNEVQLLRDELAIMQRKYEDIFNNLQYELPYINGKYTITEDLTLSGTVKWEMKNSPVKTQYSTNGTSWHDEQITGFKYMRMSFDGGQTWTDKTQVVGENGSSASVTFTEVNSVLGNLFATWEGDTPTQANGSYIYSPMIKSGEIYGCVIYAGTGNGSYAEMNETGLDVYINGLNKIGMGYTSGLYDYPYITLGAGTDEAGTGIGCVYKLGQGLWIGDASVAKNGGDTPIGTNATGLFIDLENNIIYKYIDGNAVEI